MMVEEAISRQTPTLRQIVGLEKREAELWFRYRELDQRAKELADGGNESLLKLTRKDAVRAHRDHQRCVDLILRVHRDRLLEDSFATRMTEI